MFCYSCKGIIKWLRTLHGKRETDWNVVHPDILIFAKDISMEFQVNKKKK
jgi:hypothetical protein